jgi:predicted SAM-dependent methyltransferase
MASHVVEHIPPHNLGFIKFMNEVWRVLKPGGEFAIVCPHGRSDGYIQDPTHCNMLNENTFLYFVQDHPLWQFYKPAPWTIKYLSFDPTANIECVLVKAALHD